uniref:Putative plant transposon protein domain-containing protein n=1 Tax=Solanum tuberosum TaxID=4113 RepID=M1DET2_SOLTU
MSATAPRRGPGESYAENTIGKSEYHGVCEVVLKNSTQRLGKTVVFSSRKRVRTGTTIPPAPAVPRGQTQRYGAKTVTSEGKKWYKSHTEVKYFSDVILDDVNLEREFPHIKRCLQELHMGFIFQDPSECNVSVVQEFYANWKPDARSHIVIVRGMEVPLTPSAINQILGLQMPLLMSSRGSISALRINRFDMLYVGRTPLRNGFDMGTVVITNHILMLT